MEKIFKSSSPQQTERLGENLGNVLLPGDFVALVGDLGAGKTAFTKGIAQGLGIKDPITSPTFTIINEYNEPVSFAHMDAYRIKNIEELENIGFDDYLGDFIIVMEWANLVEEMLPSQVLWIDFQTLDKDHRHIKFTSKNPRFDKIIQELNI